MKNTTLENFVFLIISIAAYVFALTQTLFTTSGDILGFSFKKESVTFKQSINILQQQDYLLLSYVLITFVLVLPILKYFTLFLNIFNLKLLTQNINDIALYLQKYAMVDVFVISLLLIGSKNNPIFNLKIEVGTYALVVSILTSMLLSINLKQIGKTKETL